MVSLPGGNHPAPDKITIDMYDITEGGRDSTGKNHLDLVATKYKVKLEYGVLTAEEISGILTSIKPLSFNITIDDPESGGDKTIEVYKGDRSMPILTYFNGQPCYSGFTVNLIEM